MQLRRKARTMARARGASRRASGTRHTHIPREPAGDNGVRTAGVKDKEAKVKEETLFKLSQKRHGLRRSVQMANCSDVSQRTSRDLMHPALHTPQPTAPPVRPWRHGLTWLATIVILGNPFLLWRQTSLVSGVHWLSPLMSLGQAKHYVLRG